jgi:hypothetical protein
MSNGLNMYWPILWRRVPEISEEARESFVLRVKLKVGKTKGAVLSFSGSGVAHEGT